MKMGIFDKKPNVEKLARERDVGGLIKALDDKDRDVGMKAAVALAWIGEPAAKPLIQALEDEGEYVRAYAVLALEKIGEPAVKSLIQALGDENPIVRGLVARVLGEVGDKRAAEPLTQTTKDDYSGVREAAKEALKKIKKRK
jgi:HEAT repeat protein